MVRSLMLLRLAGRVQVLGFGAMSMVQTTPSGANVSVAASSMACSISSEPSPLRGRRNGWTLLRSAQHRECELSTQLTTCRGQRIKQFRMTLVLR